MDLKRLSQFLDCLDQGMCDPKWDTDRDSIISNAKESMQIGGDVYKPIFVVVDKESFCRADLDRLKYMVGMAEKVKHKTITEHTASVEVGTVLVDDFVKPSLKR